MKKKGITVIEIIVAVFIALIMILIIAGAVINQSHKISYGIVIGRDYEPCYVTFIINGDVKIPQYHPASYSLTISGEKNGKIVEYTFSVSESEYMMYQIGDNYPKEK